MKETQWQVRYEDKRGAECEMFWDSRPQVIVGQYKNVPRAIAKRVWIERRTVTYGEAAVVGIEEVK